VADLKHCFPNIQFVATTHSPFIVQSLQKSELINLETTAHTTNLEGNPLNYSIEDIAEGAMNVKDVSRSNYFQEQVDIATQYFALTPRS
jgi:predicted ATP-binding protein involved in virulence